MTPELLMRGFFVFIICAVVAYTSYFGEDRETQNEPPEGKRPRYLNFIPVYTELLFILILLVLATLSYGATQYTVRMVIWFAIGIFVHISIYFLVLIPIMPLFRRYLSARSCAQMWMLPAFMYFIFYSFMELPAPLLTVRIPAGAAKTVLIVWFSGFVVFFLYSIVSHLMFRRGVLKNASPLWDYDTLHIWREAMEDANVKYQYKLVQSDEVSSPITIGLFKHTIRVVLPAREYTEDELRLIFRHELVHIGREDAATKFYMAFNTAALWFNPLVHYAMRKSADDLELSCDETVLIGAEHEREQYARLILNAASDSRGFTSCLSARAESLRYRLKNVMSPRRRFNGGVVVGLVLFAFMMTAGFVAVSYDVEFGGEVIFSDGELAEYSVSSVSIDDTDDMSYNPKFYDCTDSAAFIQYLADLEFEVTSGRYSYKNDVYITSIIAGPDGAFGVTLTQNTVNVVYLHEKNAPSMSYMLRTPPDWDYLRSLLAER